MADGQPLLVVDDDLTFASFMVDMLKRLRVRAAVAFTGSDALRHLSRSDYRGVLLDLKLPDMSGLEVLRDLRARGHLVPVVIMTGDSSVPAAVEAMQLGALNFLEKPIMLGQLAAAVEALFSYQPPRPNRRWIWRGCYVPPAIRGGEVSGPRFWPQTPEPSPDCWNAPVWIPPDRFPSVTTFWRANGSSPTRESSTN